MKRYSFRIAGLFLALVLCLSAFAGCQRTMPDDSFAGIPEVTAYAEASKNELDWLDVKLSVTNESAKVITGLRFFAVLLDADGNRIENEVDQIFIGFSEETSLAAGESETLEFQITQRAAETFTLYLCYVCFDDGTVWGEKSANAPDIFAANCTFPVTMVERTVADAGADADQ